jgi:hypothetical protein
MTHTACRAYRVLGSEARNGGVMQQGRSAATTGILGDLGGLVTSFVRHLKAENTRGQTRQVCSYAKLALLHTPDEAVTQ